MKRYLLPAVLAAAIGVPGLAGAAWAQQPQKPAQGQNVDRATVSVNGRPVMTLATVGNQSAERRAELVRERLRQALETDPRANQKRLGAADVNVSTVNGTPVIRLKEANLITVTQADAKLMGLQPQAAAEQWAGNMRAALANLNLAAGQPLPNNFVTIERGPQTTTAAAPVTPQTQPSAEVTEFAAVRVNNREVMRLAAAGDFTPQRRAEMVRERIRSAYEHRPNQEAVRYQPSDITVETVGGMPVVRIQEANIITVTDADAKLLGQDVQTLAQQWASELRTALQNVELTREEALPRDFVTIATGQLTGGGAGTAPESKPKQKPQSKPKNP